MLLIGIALLYGKLDIYKYCFIFVPILNVIENIVAYTVLLFNTPHFFEKNRNYHYFSYMWESGDPFQIIASFIYDSAANISLTVFMTILIQLFLLGLGPLRLIRDNTEK